ncbi:SMC-Scp complex subunit ScpB [Patescibacteria group bacterium]|nr:SMC-Scp complex subunit ScpB [Patescibacteria group bacterium]
MNLEAQLEGVLFYTSEPMSIGDLAKLCEVEKEAVEQAIQSLTVALESRGIRLVREGESVALMTAPFVGDIIEKIRKDELKRDIGKAGAETLAIIAYHESVTRSEIDFIRGVNSTFILRNLMIRGLIERIPHPTDQRSFAYKPTVELYAHLGITKKDELPQYNEIVEEIRKYKNTDTEKGLSEEESTQTTV